jgi:hypothetical protein
MAQASLVGSTWDPNKPNERLKVAIPVPFPLTYQAPKEHRFYSGLNIKRAKESQITDIGFACINSSQWAVVHNKEVRLQHAKVHIFRRGKISLESMRACVLNAILTDSEEFKECKKEFEQADIAWSKAIVGYTGKHTPVEKWQWLPKTVSTYPLFLNLCSNVCREGPRSHRLAEHESLSA